MKFVTQFNWVCPPGEKNSGLSICDPSGYISPQEQIENLIRAGERLEEYRRERYDLDHGEEDDGVWMDPMREAGLDFADVYRIRQEVIRRLSSAVARGEETPDLKTELAREASVAAQQETEQAQQESQPQA